MALYSSTLDTDLFKTWEAERRALSGPAVSYFSQRQGYLVDPLYGEQTTFSYRTAFLVVANLRYTEFDAEDTSVEDDGLLDRWDAELAVAANAWSAAAPAGVSPKEGDVVYVHGKYYDVDKAAAIGEALNANVATAWKLMLKRNLHFDPVRKVT